MLYTLQVREHVFVPSPGISAPTIVLLHGMGGGEHDLVPFATRIIPQANFLSPRGDVMENGKTRFYLSGFHASDIEKRVTSLEMFFEEAAKEYGFDPENMSVLGWSNGANMATLLLLHAPHLFRKALLFRPLLPPSPGTLPRLAGVDVFVSGGTQDTVDPPVAAMQVSDLLQQAGAHATLHWHEGGHALGEDEVADARAWWIAHDDSAPSSTLPL